MVRPAIHSGGEGVVCDGGNRIEVRRGDVVIEAGTFWDAGTGGSGRIPSGGSRRAGGGWGCLTGCWWTWVGMGRPRLVVAGEAGCRRRCRGRRLGGRWTRRRWRICAGIWRITCGRRSGCGRTAARRSQESWPGGGSRSSGRCSAPARRVMRISGRGTGAWRWCSGPPSLGLLGLPWELMRDGAGPVALGAGGISRSLPVADGAETLEVRGRAVAGADGDLPPGRAPRMWGIRWWPGRCWSGWTRSAARWT